MPHTRPGDEEEEEETELRSSTITLRLGQLFFDGTGTIWQTQPCESASQDLQGLEPRPTGTFRLCESRQYRDTMCDGLFDQMPGAVMAMHDVMWRCCLIFMG